MGFTFEYLLDHIMYDVTIDGFNYHGNVDYVSSHFGDGESKDFRISKFQEPIIQPFIDEYFKVKETEPDLKLEDFYSRKAI